MKKEIITKVTGYKDIIDFNAVNGNLFVVSSKNASLNPALIYPDNGFNNSDRVRAAFAKKTGIKFTDVRCCRLKNCK